MSLLILSGAFVLLVLVFAKPKWGSFLVWPLLFTYPHSFWFHNVQMPWNMGFDDFYCIFLFVVVLVRRNFIEHVPIRFGYAFWMMLSWIIVTSIATFSGSTYAIPIEKFLYVRAALKPLVVFGMFYAIIHCIDDEKDLKNQFTAFSFAAAVGAVLVIFHYFFPYPMSIFTNPEAEVRIEYRACGAFLNANMAACVLTCSLVFILTTIRMQRNKLAKIISYSFIFLMFLGIMVTKSRSGLMCLGGTFLLMGIFSKSRKLAWLVIVSGIIVALFVPHIRELYAERIIRAYDPMTGQIGGNIAGRIDTWKSYFETATTQIYLFGQGTTQGHVRNGGEPHSAYVSFITVYGLGGVIWCIFGLTIFFRKILQLRKNTDLLLSSVSIGCFWALMAWGIFGITADSISSTYTKYVLFYMIILDDRASFFANYLQQDWLLDEELDYNDDMVLQSEGAY